MDESFKKVIKTINSCKTREHLDSSMRLIFLYLKQFKNNVIEYDNKYNELNVFFRNKRGEITINDKK